MKADELFNKLWKQYSEINVQANQIHALLRERGEDVVNDHIALRTFNLPGVNVESLSRVFKDMGYVEKGTYEFEQKKLVAKHYELAGQPRVFISELKVEEFSPFLQETVKKLMTQIPSSLPESESFVVSGRSWSPVSFATYKKLRQESEYAAWLVAFGYIANHFTISVNALTTFDDLAGLNTFIKDSGFNLNQAGGEIKGSEKVFLAQSSTLAAEVRAEFAESEHLIPCCYYEFAQRFNMADGNEFSGFVAQSADKIFESTDVQ
jgi:hypothetical protein